jgi:NitT/TauT family transport system ATP-binding protein
MLNIKNLKKRYHTEKNEIEALEDISFDLKSNEIISIIGPSGCGKSTILSILAGVETKSSGEINNSFSFGYMLQNDLLFDWLNIYENCIIGLKIKKQFTPENIKYVNELLEKYNLASFKNVFPNQLSGGMKQRAALIRTLALKPDVLLLDEPFSQLDSQTRIDVSNDVYNIIKNENKSVILVTHDIEEAICMSDRIILLSKAPAKIVKEYKIDIDNKLTPIEKRLDPKMNKYFKEILSDFKKNV